MRRKKIGAMDFHGSVDITDPCYNRDVWCRMNDVKIHDGSYTCIAWYQTDKGEYDGKPYSYKVVGILGIYLDGIIPCQKEMKEIGSIGVDAAWPDSSTINRTMTMSLGAHSATGSHTAMSG